METRLIFNIVFTYLSQKCDWLLTHGMGVSYVCSDDLSKWFLYTL